MDDHDHDNTFGSPLELMKIDMGSRFIPGKHLELIDNALMDLLHGKTSKTAIFLPPRHSKSSLASIYFPAFVMCTEPHMNIIQVSYGKSLTEQFSRASRDLTDYYGNYPVRKDLMRSDEYKLESPYTSHLVARGVGGAITGFGGDLIIADDLTRSAEDSLSPTYKEKLRTYWDGTLSSRLEPKGKQLLVSTRWSEDDICSHVMDEEDWTIVDLPAECLDEETDPLNRKLGEALWPERWPKTELVKRRTRLGEYWYNCTYLNRPVPLTGNMMDPELFNSYYRCPVLRDQRHRIMTVDLAISESPRADETVITILDVVRGTDKPGFYVDKQIAGRWNSNRSTREIAKQYNLFHPDMLFVETVGFQKVIADNLRDMGIPVLNFQDNRKKEVKLLELLPFMEQGKIYLKTGEDWDVLKHQVRSFPLSPKDDRHESLWMAISKAGGGNPYTESNQYHEFSEGAKKRDANRPEKMHIWDNNRVPYSIKRDTPYTRSQSNHRIDDHIRKRRGFRF